MTFIFRIPLFPLTRFLSLLGEPSALSRPRNLSPAQLRTRRVAALIGNLTEFALSRSLARVVAVEQTGTSVRGGLGGELF